jgi:hypothetical protein
MPSLLNLKIDLIQLSISLSFLGIDVSDVSPNNRLTSLSCMVVLHLIRAQNSEILYLKYLNSLPINRLTIDQLEYLILGLNFF